MTERTHTIIPAQPGWYVATFAAETNHLDHIAIVAWDIKGTVDDNDYTVNPMTYGYFDLSHPFAIKRPDGMYEVPGFDGVTFNETSVLVHLGDECDQREAQRNRAPPPDPPLRTTSTS